MSLSVVGRVVRSALQTGRGRSAPTTVERKGTHDCTIECAVDPSLPSRANGDDIDEWNGNRRETEWFEGGRGG